MRVLLTGATGVVGRRVVPELIADGHHVSAVARSGVKAEQLRAQGAEPVHVDLFDADAVAAAVTGHDAVVHLATNIPTGADAAVKRGWRTNDRLRTEAVDNLHRAASLASVGRFVQESITFPYVDGGSDWIDEDRARGFFWGNASTRHAEERCQSFASQGGQGVVLRFAMFFAPDSAHVGTFAAMAKRGVWGVFGSDQDHISFVHVDDAATAVVAALSVPSGIYNVAEPDPVPRSEHRRALASAVGRARLRAFPSIAQRAMGPGVESLARSHRIDSRRLTDVSDWRPTRRIVDHWADTR